MASVNRDVTSTARVALDFCSFFAPFLPDVLWVGSARPRLLGFSF